VIPYGRQSVSEGDIEAVEEVLRSDWLTQGPAIERFEAAVAAYCGVKYAVAVCNATAALHLAALAAGMGPGGSLWTSPNTFVASANCGLYCGGTVDFVDIDARTYNMGVACLERKLEAAAASGTLPKVLVPVHFAGQSCEMEAIAALARKHGIVLIEDAAHAIGGAYRGNPVGSCRYSDMAVFSFHPVKIITTGEGGMIVTNDPLLHRKLIRLRSHGITREEAEMRGPSEGPWYYQQVELGYNYRMTDMQAALGCSQLARIDGFVATRKALAARYAKELRDLPVGIPFQHPDSSSSFHLYPVLIDSDRVGVSKRSLFEGMRKAGIGVNLHYIPVHTQPYYRDLGFRAGDFPAAEAYYAATMSLPIYHGMTEAQQDQVVSSLRQVLEA
jgi:UDP-4-amino-4,6-dideoxy-N-acetyl-beta-L-altrosamine transaminase